MYLDVSCVYPAEYMYPKCILHVSQMYLKCSVLKSKYRREYMYMYLVILHVFYTYPKGVQDTFGIHIRYINIHVSCALLPISVTLDSTYHFNMHFNIRELQDMDTDQEYVYLGLFIKIHIPDGI